MPSNLLPVSRRPWHRPRHTSWALHATQKTTCSTCSARKKALTIRLDCLSRAGIRAKLMANLREAGENPTITTFHRSLAPAGTRPGIAPRWDCNTCRWMRERCVYTPDAEVLVLTAGRPFLLKLTLHSSPPPRTKKLTREIRTAGRLRYPKEHLVPSV